MAGQPRPSGAAFLRVSALYVRRNVDSMPVSAYPDDKPLSSLYPVPNALTELSTFGH